MCYYNFIRPHSALKFVDETRTPAMQAGLAKKQLSFREIFTAIEIIFWWIFMFLRNRIRTKEFYMDFGLETTVALRSTRKCGHKMTF
jgi:hypothetical protein